MVTPEWKSVNMPDLMLLLLKLLPTARELDYLELVNDGKCKGRLVHFWSLVRIRVSINTIIKVERWLSLSLAHKGPSYNIILVHSQRALTLSTWAELSDFFFRIRTFCCWSGIRLERIFGTGTAAGFVSSARASIECFLTLGTGFWFSSFDETLIFEPTVRDLILGDGCSCSSCCSACCCCCCSLRLALGAHHDLRVCELRSNFPNLEAMSRTDPWRRKTPTISSVLAALFSSSFFSVRKDERRVQKATRSVNEVLPVMILAMIKSVITARLTQKV